MAKTKVPLECLRLFQDTWAYYPFGENGHLDWLKVGVIEDWNDFRKPVPYEVRVNALMLGNDARDVRVTSGIVKPVKAVAYGRHPYCFTKAEPCAQYAHYDGTIVVSTCSVSTLRRHQREESSAIKVFRRVLMGSYHRVANVYAHVTCHGEFDAPYEVPQLLPIAVLTEYHDVAFLAYVYDNALFTTEKARGVLERTAKDLARDWLGAQPRRVKRYKPKPCSDVYAYTGRAARERQDLSVFTEDMRDKIKRADDGPAINEPLTHMSVKHCSERLTGDVRFRDPSERCTGAIRLISAMQHEPLREFRVTRDIKYMPCQTDVTAHALAGKYFTSADVFTVNTRAFSYAETLEQKRLAVIMRNTFFEHEQEGVGPYNPGPTCVLYKTRYEPSFESKVIPLLQCVMYDETDGHVRNIVAKASTELACTYSVLSIVCRTMPRLAFEYSHRERATCGSTASYDQRERVKNNILSALVSSNAGPMFGYSPGYNNYIRDRFSHSKSRWCPARLKEAFDGIQDAEEKVLRYTKAVKFD